jgi:xylan 1,4-beta-xylosidase
MARSLGLALLLCLLAVAPAGAKVPTIRVDFSKRLERPTMVGFVHGMDMRAPSDALIDPLEPALWRGKLRDVPYERVAQLGGRYTYILSDRWGYPGSGGRPPYEDFGAWRRFVRNVARAARGVNDVLFDVWNEPNEPHFWRGTREQLYETYRIAENVLRAELGPDVLVGGPSTLGWRADWIYGLLDWCRARGCQVNVLSWHELTSGPIPAIADRLRFARNALLESSAYAPLRIQEIHINEAGIAADQYRPGELLGVLHYLEAGGADAAARTCWDETGGGSNCYSDTLAGLLTPGTFERRSTWWATKAYADGVGSRVLTRFSDPHLIGIASSQSDRPRTAQLLIAHLRGHNAERLDVEVSLRGLGRLGFLRGERRLKVWIERFPDYGERPLSAPRGRRPALVSIRRGEATLKLHDVRIHEAFRLRISEPSV